MRSDNVRRIKVDKMTNYDTLLNLLATKSKQDTQVIMRNNIYTRASYCVYTKDDVSDDDISVSIDLDNIDADDSAVAYFPSSICLRKTAVDNCTFINNTFVIKNYYDLNLVIVIFK